MAVADRERLTAAFGSALRTLEIERTTARESADSAQREVRPCSMLYYPSAELNIAPV